MANTTYSSNIENKLEIYVITDRTTAEEYVRLRGKYQTIDEILLRNINTILRDTTDLESRLNQYRVYHLPYNIIKQLPKLGYDSPEIMPPLPEITRVPDGSLGHGTDVYGNGWIVKGLFIPSLNKIYLIESAGEDVFNHEVSHWFGHWLGLSDGLTRAQEESRAEKDKLKARNFFENVRSELN